jgi:hyaluronan synthase
MFREARFLAVCYLVDIAVPFVLTGTVVAWVSAFLHYHDKMNIYRQLSISQGTVRSLVTLFCLAMFMSLLSLTTRFGRHFAYKPGELLYLPVFMAINTLLLLPIRMLGFIRMGHDDGWGTRSDSYGGERSRSPLVVVPYVLGLLMLAGSVMISVQ